jgi:hypothetical protein
VVTGVIVVILYSTYRMEGTGVIVIILYSTYRTEGTESL